MASQDDEVKGCSDPLHTNAAIGQLAQKVDGLLTGGLHGGFYEESRGSSKNRHQQLPEMFQLRQQLKRIEDNQEKLQRTAIIKQEQAAAAAPRPSAMSGSNTATMENVVNRLTANKFRDIELLSQRLKDSEKEAKMLRDKVEDLEFKLKTKKSASVKGDFPSMNQHEGIERRVAKLEMALAQQAKDHKKNLALINSDLANLTSKMNDMGGDLWDEIRGVQERIDEILVSSDEDEY